MILNSLSFLEELLSHSLLHVDREIVFLLPGTSLRFEFESELQPRVLHVIRVRVLGFAGVTELLDQRIVAFVQRQRESRSYSFDHIVSGVRGGLYLVPE